MDIPSEQKKIFRSINSLFLVQIANYALPLISIPIISRIIGPDKLGIINYSIAFISYFNLLIGYAFDFTATRKIASNSQNIDLRNKVFSEVINVKFFLFIISIILFIVCIYTFPALFFNKHIAVFTFLCCFATVTTQNWLFQAMQDLPKIAVLNFIGKLLFTLLVLLLIKNKEDYIWQPLITSLIQILISIISFYWAYKKYRLRLTLIPLSVVLKILWDERILFFTMVVVSIYTTTNTVILGLIRNEQEVGYYTASQRLIEVVNSIINIPLAQTLYPFIGTAFSESKEKGILIVQKIFPIIVIFTGLIAIALWLLGPLILTWFYGAKFIPSIAVFKIVSFVPMVVALGNVFGVQIMLNMKMDKEVFIVTIGGAIFGAILNFFMTYWWGYVGTAFNLLIAEIYITLGFYVVLRIKGINPLEMSYFNFHIVKDKVQSLLKK